MAGRLDQLALTRIQQENDIVDVISEHVKLTKKGKEMVGLCPFHDDHKPSMSVSPTKQIYKCFACGAGGDVFKFIQMRENLTFPQAIQRLADRAGIKIQPDVFTARKKGPDDFDPKDLIRANTWAAKYFQSNLVDENKGQKTRDYLEQRKINADSIKKWQLGLALADNDMVKAAKEKNIPEKLLSATGLAVKQNSTLNDKFRNRLIFPITDATARIIGFGGRTLEDASAKYINSPTTTVFDKSNLLYGLHHGRHQIVADDVAIVVEGYTDCIMAHQLGLTNVVASMGTSFTPGQGRLLKRYAKQIVLLFDSDTAGIEAANRALEICISQRIDIKIATIPKGKDPCEFLLTAGKKQFQKLIDNAVDVFDFKWKRLNEKFNTDDTLTGRRNAIEEFLQTTANVIHTRAVSPVDIGLIVNKFSRIINLNNREINDQLKRIINTKKNASNQKVESVDLGQGLAAAAQCEILEVLINEPAMFENVKESITLADFDVPIFAQIAEVLFGILSSDTEFSIEMLLGNIESVEIANVVTDLEDEGRRKGNYEPRLTGALSTLKRLKKQMKKDRITSIEDKKKLLQFYTKHASRENRHNIGMT